MLAVYVTIQFVTTPSFCAESPPNTTRVALAVTSPINSYFTNVFLTREFAGILVNKPKYSISLPVVLKPLIVIVWQFPSKLFATNSSGV